jgi:hypothetical protein
VTPGSLHALFERLFGGTDDATMGAAHAREIAHLATGQDHGEKDTLDVAELAAYLDGGLDEEAQQDIHSRLSQSPTALHDATSADAFLETVTAAREAAPPDLVTSVIAKSQPVGISASSPHRPNPIWKWSGVALAMALAALAALVIVGRTTPPTDTTQPVTAKSVPSPDTAPPKLAQPQPGAPPAIAGEKITPTYLAPAASEETMPPPSSRPGKPGLAPEGIDTMPGQPQQSR